MKQEAPSPLLAEGARPAAVRNGCALALRRPAGGRGAHLEVVRARYAGRDRRRRARPASRSSTRGCALGADGSATGLIGKRRLSPPSAALANGAAAHALDFDDQHDPARVHTSCVALPALLATAEDPAGYRARISARLRGERRAARAPGPRLLQQPRQGLASDDDIRHRSPRARRRPAAGAGCGTPANALGFAFHQASGSAQSMRDGVLSKRMGAGFAARARCWARSSPPTA